MLSIYLIEANCDLDDWYTGFYRGIVIAETPGEAFAVMNQYCEDNDINTDNWGKHEVLTPEYSSCRRVGFAVFDISETPESKALVCEKIVE